LNEGREAQKASLAKTEKMASLDHRGRRAIKEIGETKARKEMRVHKALPVEMASTAQKVLMVKLASRDLKESAASVDRLAPKAIRENAGLRALAGQCRTIAGSAQNFSSRRLTERGARVLICRVSADRRECLVAAAAEEAARALA